MRKRTRVRIQSVTLFIYLKFYYLIWNANRLSRRAGMSAFAELVTRDVVSAELATATWLGGCLSVTAGIVSKQLNLS